MKKVISFILLIALMLTMQVNNSIIEAKEKNFEYIIISDNMANVTKNYHYEELIDNNIALCKMSETEAATIKKNDKCYRYK